MGNDKNVPKLRFPGFTDAWEQRKLGDEFERVNERNNGQFGITHWISVAKMYYQEPDKVQSNNLDTRTYVMRKGDIAFEGHPNSEFQFGRFVANDIGDGIISELFPIYRHKLPYENSYWKYAIQLERVMRPIYAKAITSSGASSNKLNEEHFLRENILVPQLYEQRAIGAFFTSIDNLITLHQCKCDEVKKIKNCMLQKLLPKDGERFPEIRFPGFTDEWEQRKFREILIEYTNKSIIEDEYPVLSSTNTGMEFRNGRVSGTSNIGYKIINLNDLVLSPQNLWLGNININDIGTGIVSPSYKTFKLRGVEMDFLRPQIRSTYLMNEYYNASIQGASVVRRNLDVEKFNDISILLPSSSEQVAIGCFFRDLDNFISTHQRKTEELKKYKQYLLQNMFI